MSIALTPGLSEPTSIVPVGTSVDVRNRFIGTWSCGFEVAGMNEQGYLIRRLSDMSVLPEAFGFDEVRPR